MLDPWTAYRNSMNGTTATESELSSSIPGWSRVPGNLQELSTAGTTTTKPELSTGEIIRNKQKELKQKLMEMARTEYVASAPPVPVIAPPGMEGPEMRRPARRCKLHHCKKTHEKEMTTTEIQTTISLPHTMREVLWTASSFEPRVDESDHAETGAPPQSTGVTGIIDYPSDEAQLPKLHMIEETNVGKGVMDLDILEEEENGGSEANEIFGIHGMKADELYAYVFTLIMLMLIMDMKSRGENFRSDDKISLKDLVNYSDVDISPLSEVNSKMPKERKMRLKRGITIDSGAGNSVMPRRMVLDKSSIRESAGSRAGVNYVPAGGGRIPNEGEFDLAFKTSEGNAEAWTFQVAEINKALCAVSQLVDLGYKVIFDKNLETGQDMSYMTYKAANVTSRLRRERNVWILDAYVSLDANNSEQGFHRRG